MYRLATTIVLSSVAMAQTVQDAEIAAAVKSPIRLARYVESHNTVDWKALRSTLGLKSQDWFEPCGSSFPAAEAPCSAEIVTVANPEQAIVIIRGGDLSYTVEHLRYLRDPKVGWQFAGEYSAFKKDGPSHHEVMRVAGKTFLKISSTHSEAGVGVSQEVEDWFDLTQPDFEPVFSFTVEGHRHRYGFGVSRNIREQCSLSQVSGLERIDVILSVHFEGPDLDLEAMYLGVYERPANAKKFTPLIAYSSLDRRTTISTKDFEELADPFEGPSNEKLLVYAFPGLQKIAGGSDPDAKEWLRSILSNAQDTLEKRSLLGLLAKP